MTRIVDVGISALPVRRIQQTDKPKFRERRTRAHSACRHAVRTISSPLFQDG